MCSLFEGNPDSEDLVTFSHRISELFALGKISEANEQAKLLTEIYPNFALGWRFLGISYSLLEFHEFALIALRRLVEIVPDQPEAHSDYALALHCGGKIDEALSEYGVAIRLNPQYTHAHFNIANLYKKIKKNRQAEIHYRRAIEISPAFKDAYINLGSLLIEDGRINEAIDNYKVSVALSPNDSAAYNNLGVAFDRNKQHNEAIECYKRAISISPHFFQAHCNLGDSFKALKNIEQAKNAYQNALSVEPNCFEAYFNLGAFAFSDGDYINAITLLKKALEINPAYYEAYVYLGFCFDSIAQYEDSLIAFKNARKIRPGDALAVNQIALSLCNMWQHNQALEGSEAALLEANDCDTKKAIYGGILQYVNYNPDLAENKIFAFYEAYAKTIEDFFYQKQFKSYPNIKKIGKKLRVGYVAATFYRHSTSHFLLPLIEGHNKEAFEVFLYGQSKPQDEVTEQYKESADLWIEVDDLSDLKLTDRIRSDQIDILIDVAGHTRGGRLEVFARKPSPISLHWLDFGYTTGVKAIDYYLTDFETVPLGAENLFSEKPWRLKSPAFVYRAESGMGEVSSLPALTNNYVTFGTFTRSIRLNEQLIATWSEILHRVENSRLVVNSFSFMNKGLRQRLIRSFSQYGIDEDRLEIGLETPPWDVFRRIDISLDCFPHNSGTTLFQSIYMGIPFITLRNRPSVGRLGASVLVGLGRSEWVADSMAEYIEKAVALASNIGALSQIRGELRQQMQESVLMNEMGFVHEVETAYLRMWDIWVNTESNIL